MMFILWLLLAASAVAVVAALENMGLPAKERVQTQRLIIINSLVMMILYWWLFLI